MSTTNHVSKIVAKFSTNENDSVPKESVNKREEIRQEWFRQRLRKFDKNLNEDDEEEVVLRRLGRSQSLKLTPSIHGQFDRGTLLDFKEFLAESNSYVPPKENDLKTKKVGLYKSIGVQLRNSYERLRTNSFDKTLKKSKRNDSETSDESKLTKKKNKKQIKKKLQNCDRNQNDKHELQDIDDNLVNNVVLQNRMDENTVIDFVDEFGNVDESTYDENETHNNATNESVENELESSLKHDESETDRNTFSDVNKNDMNKVARAVHVYSWSISGDGDYKSTTDEGNKTSLNSSDLSLSDSFSEEFSTSWGEVESRNVSISIDDNKKVDGFLGKLNENDHPVKLLEAINWKFSLNDCYNYNVQRPDTYDFISKALEDLSQLCNDLYEDNSNFSINDAQKTVNKNDEKDTDNNLSRCPIPLYALNVTDYDEDTLKFTSKMTVHLSNKSQPTTPTTKQMKRSQSNKFDNLVRYSSTSSSSFEVDDRTSVRSEIYYDNNQMPRIETVRSIDKDIYLEESIEKKKPKLEYIIKELVETEEKYVENLRMIQKDYIDYLRTVQLSEVCEKTLPGLIGNLEEIYIQSRFFLSKLKRCNYDWKLIANTFLENEKLFKLYPIYSRNKPKSERLWELYFKDVLKARQLELKQSLDLASYLLMPIQRLGKYKLMLNNIRDELKTDKNDAINDAISLIEKQLRRGNDYIAIDSIYGWPKIRGDLLDALGSFVMRDMFILKNDQCRKAEVMVFLFDNVIIFTVQIRTDGFQYRKNIHMHKLGLVIIEHEPLIFHLREFGNKKKKIFTHVLEAKTPTIKNAWTNYLQSALFNQLNQEKQKRKSSVSTTDVYQNDTNSIRKTGNSRFYTTSQTLAN